MSGWGSSQESLLSQLTMMGYPSAYARTAILSNMKADLFGLLDWLEKNPAPSTSTTKTTGPDEDIKRIAKAEEDSKKEKIAQLREMGFTLAQATYVTNKFPSAPLTRLLDWLDSPSNLREISSSGSPGGSSGDDAWVIVDQNKKKPKETVIKVGTKVRVLKSVRDPLHGWGSVTPDAIGVVRRVEGAQDIWVDFTKQQNWHGVRDEMEIVDEPDEEPAVEPGVPAMKTGPTPGSVGGGSSGGTRLVSPEPTPEIMRIDPDEGKEKPIRVGSKVRVKESVKNPQNGWGAVSHGIVGIVKRIDEDSAYVDFQSQKDWKAELVELECLDEEEKKSSAPVEAPDDVDALSSPDFQRGDSEMNDMLRTMFETDKKAGIRLTLDQINFILLRDHKTGTKYTCQVCYDDEVELDKLLVLDECRHYLCVTCMSKHIVTQIKNTNVSHIRCPEPDCKLMVGYSEVKRCVSEADFLLYERILLEDSLKKDPSCRWCPKAGCGTAMLGTPNPKNPMLRCPKEDCKFAFCFNCKEAWHSDSTCEQYQAWKLENSEADKRYAAWALKNTKACPGCRAPIQKNAGCNHMKCSNCKHEFCWLCMKSVLGDGGKYKPGHWALDESSPCYQKMHT